MSSIIRFLKLSSILFLFLFSTTHAQVTSPTQEAITSFGSTININLDNSIDVVENIVYTTDSKPHHGIYRDVYPYSSTGMKMDISNIQVKDENGNPQQYTVSNVNSYIRIKIGDPNVTFVGQKTYVISYHASYAVAQLADIDEIYWNATGDAWLFPIYNASATVVLPVSLIATQEACYYGKKGSTDKCYFATSTKGSVYTFTSPRTLLPSEGLTVAVGFKKGSLVPYTEKELTDRTKAATSLGNKGEWTPIFTIRNNIAGTIAVLIALLFSYMYWYRNWRDPKGTGVIVTQYDVCDGLTPMEVSGIVFEKVRTESISAEIIYLATLGYLKIRQIEEKVLYLFSVTDYELVLLKEIKDLPNEADRVFLNDLFNGSNSMKMSSLKNSFYKKLPKITNTVAESLLMKNYYKKLGKMSTPEIAKNTLKLSFFMFSSVIFIFILVAITSNFLYSVLVLGIPLFFWKYSPVKTDMGVATKEYLLGLKHYLEVAEKDRINFHNAPEKKPEVFEKLLPYAMVFGVEKAWAKEFEGMYMTPPSWYEGNQANNFSSVIFASSLSDFSSYSSSNLSSAPGSSGGGGSGGGGGGGGGGSW